MKHKLTKYLSLVLAGILQMLPLIRSALPTFLGAVRTPMGAIMARWAAGGIAYFGYHAISGATSDAFNVSISPAQAEQGKSYSGTLTWTGSYSGSVTSMELLATNGVSLGSLCLSSAYTISPGLTIQYTGGSSATISGTPTSTNLFTIETQVSRYSCTTSTSDKAIRTSPAFTIISSNGATFAPIFNNSPQNTVAIVGSSVNLFGSANGNPLPTYQWSYNLANIPGATNPAYTLNNIALTNAGQYTLQASNAPTQHPSENCVLTVIVPPGTNFTTLDWTNYAPAGVALTLTSFITNTPSATNTFAWEYDLGTTISTAQNLSLTAAQVTPNKSGEYSVFFTSSFGTNVYANSVEADSFWQFGYVPVISNQPPASQTVSSGTNVTIGCTMSGGNIPFAYLYQNGNTLVAQTNLTSYNPNAATNTTNISFTLTNVTSANSGSYTIVITNFWGSTTSAVSQLTVGTPLSVSSPAGQTNYAGKSVSLSVTPSGTAPFSYQWQDGTANVNNGGNISGATTNIITFNPAATTNSGNYRVIVNNTGGSVTSSVAVVSIVPVPRVGVALGGSNATLSASGGVPGSNYVVQVSTNLGASPAWKSVLTNLVPGNGSITYTDTNAPTNVQKFYRLFFP